MLSRADLQSEVPEGAEREVPQIEADRAPWQEQREGPDFGPGRDPHPQLRDPREAHVLSEDRGGGQHRHKCAAALRLVPGNYELALRHPRVHGSYNRLRAADNRLPERG